MLISSWSVSLLRGDIYTLSWFLFFPVKMIFETYPFFRMKGRHICVIKHFRPSFQEVLQALIKNVTNKGYFYSFYTQFLLGRILSVICLKININCTTKVSECVEQLGKQNGYMKSNFIKSFSKKFSRRTLEQGQSELSNFL